MKRFFVLLVFFFGLLSGAYYFYLPELQKIWEFSLQTPLQFIEKMTQVEEQPLYAQAIEGQPTDQSTHSQELLNDDKGFTVPEFDLPSEFPPEDIRSIESGSIAVIFKGFDRTIISSKITSTVLKINYRMGERFLEGDLLIKLDDTVFQGLKKKAEGNLNKAQAELSAKKELYEADIASIYEVKTAEANVAIAQSELINADYAIDGCYIRAPYMGKVVSLFIEEFELIQEGKPLIEIVNDQFLIGQVLAPASVISKVRLEQPVDIYVEELNEEVTGKILRIDAVIDPASSTFKIDIVVDNQQGLLKAGMIGRIILSENNDLETFNPASIGPSGGDIR